MERDELAEINNWFKSQKEKNKRLHETVNDWIENFEYEFELLIGKHNAEAREKNTKMHLKHISLIKLTEDILPLGSVTNLGQHQLEELRLKLLPINQLAELEPEKLKQLRFNMSQFHHIKEFKIDDFSKLRHCALPFFDIDVDFRKFTEQLIGEIERGEIR